MLFRSSSSPHSLSSSMTRSKSKPARRLRLRHPSGKLPTLAERLALVGTKHLAPMMDNDKSPPSLLSCLSSLEPPKTTYLDTNHHLPSPEHDHHKVDQLCYYCGHAGHFYIVCPHPKSAASLCKSSLNKDLNDVAEVHCATLNTYQSNKSQLETPIQRSH